MTEASPSCRNGWQEVTFHDGSVYHGEWCRGQRSGQGKQTYALTGNRYEGSWKDGRWDGPGRLFLCNGSSYSGEWKAGRRHGKGIEVCSLSVNTYTGDFWEDKRCGEGVLEERGKTFNVKYDENGVELWRKPFASLDPVCPDVLWLPPNHPRFTPKRVDFSRVLDSLCSPRPRSCLADGQNQNSSDFDRTIVDRQPGRQSDAQSDRQSDGQSDGQPEGLPEHLLSFTNKPEGEISVLPNRHTLTESEISIRDGTNQNAVIKATLVFDKFDQTSQNFLKARKPSNQEVPVIMELDKKSWIKIQRENGSFSDRQSNSEPGGVKGSPPSEILAPRLSTSPIFPRVLQWQETAESESSTSTPKHLKYISLNPTPSPLCSSLLAKFEDCSRRKTPLRG
uniref:MORN repeat-containing protein 5 n=1 Tax=Hanusia phi TaxID=3032 RepID=A0A7S0HKI1_9CRYP|mmetsp:Transcript_22733/g.51241  ORF Transcript_22733/g.51241 Transcript_22733/m.51241 type:complete len:393 (+) Transcript_22733:63-1241(+)